MTPRALRLRSVVRHAVGAAFVVALCAVMAWAGYYSGEGL